MPRIDKKIPQHIFGRLCKSQQKVKFSESENQQRTDAKINFYRNYISKSEPF
jgi:hypothetical protein